MTHGGDSRTHSGAYSSVGARRIVTEIVWTPGKEDKTQFLSHNVMLKVLVANLIGLINL